MNKWCEFYAKVMGFAQIISFDDKDISTEYTALMSKVMSNGNGRIKFLLMSQLKERKSQIEEYIQFYNGTGVQHIAVATDDIVSTVSAMRDRGVEFLYVPENYYDDLLERVGEIDEDVGIEATRNLDRDDEGYFYSYEARLDKTMFFEIIQRKGAQSFGKEILKHFLKRLKGNKKIEKRYNYSF